MKLQRSLAYLKYPSLAAVMVTLLDLLFLQLVYGSIIRDTLVLVLFLEGGLGLITGTGIVLSSTPSISKIGEATIGTASWSKEGERHAERVGGKWIFASTLTILIGFALSVV